jgi:5-hydroxyisourate hydrolase-like protein (transthyretin family)
MERHFLVAIFAVLVALGSSPAEAQSLPPDTGHAPNVHLDTYSAKPAQTLAFTGTGFVPKETVDVSLGDQSLTTITADDEGRILHASIGIPLLSAGDYTVSFVGQTSRIPVTVALNIHGVRPWVVLSNYYVSPQSGVGFNGEDFVPGETVAVYLNSTVSAPLAQVTADADGRITAASALTPTNLAGGNRLIFVGQQSQVELTATFTVAAP